MKVSVEVLRPGGLSAGYDTPAGGLCKAGRRGPRGREIDVEELCRGIGVAHVASLDPFETERREEELDAAFDQRGALGRGGGDP